MKNRKTLITGVAGFLGSALAERLIKQGEQVVGIDDLSHGDKKRVSELRGSAFKFIEGDIRDRNSVRSCLDGVTHVVNLAELKMPRYGGSLEMLEVNCEGTESLLEEVKERNLVFVQGSTDEVYGKCTDNLMNEESPLVMGPSNVQRWGYAISKVMAEHLCLAMSQKYGFPTAILRYSGAFGPSHSVDWLGGAPAVFIQKALKGDAFPIHGDGLQTRTFTYVDDLIDATVLALDSSVVHSEILNVASEETISIVNLAYLIWRLVGRKEKPKFDFLPYTDFSANYEDARGRGIDVSKAFYLMGFKAKTQLDQGLSKTIDWQRQLAPVARTTRMREPEIST